MKKKAQLIKFCQEELIYSLKTIKSQLLKMQKNTAADAALVDVGEMQEAQVKAQGEHRGEKNMKAAAHHGVEVVFAEAEVQFFKFTAGSQKSIGREASEFWSELDGRAQAVQS